MLFIDADSEFRRLKDNGVFFDFVPAFPFFEYLKFYWLSAISFYLCRAPPFIFTALYPLGGGRLDPRNYFYEVRNLTSSFGICETSPNWKVDTEIASLYIEDFLPYDYLDDCLLSFECLYLSFVSYGIFLFIINNNLNM